MSAAVSAPSRALRIVAVATVIAAVALGGAGCTIGADRAEIPTTTVPPWRSWIVSPKPEVRAVTVLASPDGPPLRLDSDEDGTAEPVSLADRLPSGAPLALLARSLDRVVGGRRFHEVYLPVRPNASVGWVADEDVIVRRTDYRIRIDLGTRTLEVSDGARVVGTYPVAVGTAENPTPAGTYFITEKIAPSDPAGAYGPLAFGLSGHSDTIRDSQEFADGVIGVHGTNQPELIGQAVSHGCIRLRNEDISAIGALPLPLGTPVEITS